MKKNQLSRRREFLSTVAAGAVTMGMMSIPSQLRAFPTMSTEPGTDIEEWFKVKGKHRVVFDATHPNGVLPFAWPKVFLMTNDKTGTPEKENSAVVVLRHDAIPYAFEDKLWEKYKFGEYFKADDPLTSKPAIRNPFNHPKPGDFKLPGVGPVPIGINELQDAGVKFCVCEMAMMVHANVMAQKIGKDANEILKDWKEGILPGVQPVPSGVWALGRAQENGCAYIFAG
jgi:intracellular sulfur oxidation DsrE/DsrF family protein